MISKSVFVRAHPWQKNKKAQGLISQHLYHCQKFPIYGFLFAEKKKTLYFCSENGINVIDMGQLAFLKMFILVAISLDVNDNRRHVHVFMKGKRHQHSVAKIWIEKDGEPCVEIAESELSAKDNVMLVNAINRHWDFINNQITKVFNGEKTISMDIEK